MPTITPRPLSLLERYALARSLIGSPHPITLLATFSPPSSPALPALRARIVELQTLWPHLFARIEGINTNAPSWVGGERPWTGEEVVFHQLVPTDGSTAERKELLYQDSVFFRSLSTREHVEPLLRFTLYESTSGGPSYLALSIHHALTDGTGALRILSALVAPSIADLQPEDLPPRFEDVHDIRPSYAQLSSLAWNQLSSKVSWFQSAPDILNWPGPVASPSTCPEACSLLDLDTSALVPVCKARKLTLQPVLLTAVAWALTAVLETTRPDQPEFEFCGVTPRSDRASASASGTATTATTAAAATAIGRAHATGNYVSPITHTFTQPRRSETRNFWAHALAVSARLADPNEIKAARQVVGQMAYIPNGATATTATTAAPTAWETFWLGEAQKPAPYSSAFEVSNLGRTAFERVDWVQPTDPFGAALNVNVVGHEQGLSVSMTWREGCALALTQVREVEVVLERLVQRLGAGVEGYERLVR